MHFAEITWKYIGNKCGFSQNASLVEIGALPHYQIFGQQGAMAESASFETKVDFLKMVNSKRMHFAEITWKYIGNKCGFSQNASLAELGTLPAISDDWQTGLNGRERVFWSDRGFTQNVSLVVICNFRRYSSSAFWVNPPMFQMVPSLPFRLNRWNRTLRQGA